MGNSLIINSSPNEVRVALLENGAPVEVHVERRAERGVVGNIYRGRVVRVLPGMQAAFVNIGIERTGFLYVDDALPRPLGDEAHEEGLEGEGDDAEGSATGGDGAGSDHGDAQAPNAQPPAGHAGGAPAGSGNESAAAPGRGFRAAPCLPAFLPARRIPRARCSARAPIPFCARAGFRVRARSGP